MSEVQTNFPVACPPYGQIIFTDLRTHGPDECAGHDQCVLHNPSDHPLNDQPLVWRADRWPEFMERYCKHGVGHPDPDSLAYLRGAMDPEDYTNAAVESHGCDGCCTGGDGK